MVIPKAKGGLGVSNFHTTNNATLLESREHSIGKLNQSEIHQKKKPREVYTFRGIYIWKEKEMKFRILITEL